MRTFNLLCQAALWARVVAVGPVVSTTQGLVEGKVDEKLNVSIWMGIPFAAPPVGALRWAPPQYHAPWENVLSAKRPGPLCYQFGLGNEEKCLTLNVFAPSGAKAGSLPVMFSIYGGGDMGGNAGLTGLYDGRNLVHEQGVVLVSVNYRVNGIGFAALPALMREHNTTGNYGLLDQQLGMRWTQDNIKGFGGDPSRVLIFGQSAGGHAVVSHMAMPSSAGLFHSAIAESSYPVAYRSLESATASGEKVAAQLGCPSSLGDVEQLKCVRALPTGKASRLGGTAAIPVIDGIKGIPKHPLAKDCDFLDVPVAIGDVHDEQSFFLPQVVTAKLELEVILSALGMNKTVKDDFHKNYATTPGDAFGLVIRDYLFVCSNRAALQNINRQRKQTGSDVDAYWFVFNYSMGDSRAWHGLGDFHTSELAYVFDNPWVIWHRPNFTGNWTEADKRMARTMGSYWATMAREANPNGDPKCQDCVKWPPYTSTAPGVGLEAHMHFDQPLRVRTALEEWGKGESDHAHYWPQIGPFCDFWDKWGYFDRPSHENFEVLRNAMNKFHRKVFV